MSKTQTDFYNKPSLRQRPKSSINPIHPKQNLFYQPKPTREYNRFPEARIANSGTDRNGVYTEFISKDIIRPLERPNLYDQFSKPQRPSSVKWSLRTTKMPTSFETLPKYQQYKEYHIPPKQTEKQINSYREYSIKTDHIGLKIPNSTKNKPEINNGKYSYFKTRNEYNVTAQSNSYWVPCGSFKTISNISSKDYNIINFLPNNNCMNVNGGIFDRTLNFKKKGVGEYADLTKTYSTNFDKRYSKLYTENPNRFKKCTGIFSNMYDSAHRNSNLSIPFERSARDKKE